LSTQLAWVLCVTVAGIVAIYAIKKEYEE
jgi:hypothetical protein